MPEEKIISTTDLYKEIRALAVARGYNLHSMKWLSSMKAFTQQIKRSAKNIENGGWISQQISGGPQRRHWKFTKKDTIA